MRRLIVVGCTLFASAFAGWAISPGAQAATTTVAVQDDLFSPAAITINVGDTVEWTFTAAANSHSVTSETAGVFNSGIRDPGSAAFSFTFANAGTYDYYCTVHGTSMSGTVTVQEAANTATPTAAAGTPTRTRTPGATATAQATATPVATTAVASPTSATANPISAPVDAAPPPPSGGAAPAAASPRAAVGAPAAGSGPGTAGTPIRAASFVLAIAGACGLAAAFATRRRA
jgi:plastocyanin